MVSETGFNRQKDCRYGRVVYNINDRYVGRSFDLYGEFSEGEVALFRLLLEPGNVVLDVGANIGGHTLFFARAVGLTGLVLAFEPQRVVFQTLCANLAVNSLMNTRCYHAALGERRGCLKVPYIDYGREENYGGISFGAFTEGEDVDVFPLDELPLPNCRLIKVDVEGMELSVLRGAADTIRRFRPFLYVENNPGDEDRSAALIRFIASLGYDLYWHTPYLYNPDNHAGNPHNVFGPIVSHNMFCVPQEAGHSIAGLARVEVPE